MSDDVIKAANPEKNMHAASIEELINSNLDSAAADVLGNATVVAEDDLAVDGMSVQAVVEENLPKEIDLDELLDAADIELDKESQPEIQVAVDPEALSLELGSEETVDAKITATSFSEGKEIEDRGIAQVESEHSGSIDSLESEVSELESEIQTQMDKLIVKADHLKANIQNEIKRVSADNEVLQQQVAELTQQLSAAEEKVQDLAAVQDRQQVTIQKLIRILKGINTKITHIYDEN